MEFEDLTIEDLDRLLLRGRLSPEHVGLPRMLLECVGDRHVFSGEEVRKMSVREAMSLEPKAFIAVDGFGEEDGEG